MKGSNIGELEELVLLVIGVLFPEAYGVAIQQEIKDRTGRSVNISAIHTVLKRLEKKGFVRSEMGGATDERGGRRKRLFTITQPGRNILERQHEERNALWNAIPKLTWERLALKPVKA